MSQFSYSQTRLLAAPLLQTTREEGALGSVGGSGDRKSILLLSPSPSLSPSLSLSLPLSRSPSLSLSPTLSLANHEHTCVKSSHFRSALWSCAYGWLAYFMYRVRRQDLTPEIERN